MNGTEQTIFENMELGEYSGYIFLDDMQAGDTITIRVYIKDEEDEAYKLWDSSEYNNVQTKPTTRIPPLAGKVGIKITARQTAGSYREITYCWFKR